VTVCLGSSFAIEAGAAWAAGFSMSFSVSGGGSVVSGIGIDASAGLSACCARPAWLDTAKTSATAVEASRLLNRGLFTTFLLKLS
jgi:hypothetical protein